MLPDDECPCLECQYEPCPPGLCEPCWERGHDRPIEPSEWDAFDGGRCADCHAGQEETYREPGESFSYRAYREQRMK